ncbi:carbohydrate ABC transporter permease [Cohnella caldifontis]|uniref:carbohydrate ABC transporter permease n=1 Tax=Cohnella caldifontis TaxID=3027471 RepID=UPI0023ECC06E|nr:carbohydrate ABC transporter permease [Cohnella sp. YIM B05605]
MGKRKTATAADIVIVLVMSLICAVMLYPFLYSLAYSLSDSNRAMVERITVWPAGFTLNNYKVVFENSTIVQAFLITVLRTAAGVVYAGAIVALAAYAITKRQMPGNRLIALFLIIPMYFTGGLLPTYIWTYKLELFNNPLVYILPYGFWAFNMLIVRTFFDTIPAALEESAKIDGASDFKVFLKIVLPLSMPVTATIAMFNGVWHWNAWFDAMLYVTDEKLYPLQYLLQKILKESTLSQTLAAQGNLGALGNGKTPTSPESLKMTTLIISTVPIVLIYPFLQKYFIKGFLVGAVKG